MLKKGKSLEEYGSQLSGLLGWVSEPWHERVSVNLRSSPISRESPFLLISVERIMVDEEGVICFCFEFL